MSGHRINHSVFWQISTGRNARFIFCCVSDFRGRPKSFTLTLMLGNPAIKAILLSFPARRMWPGIITDAPRPWVEIFSSDCSTILEEHSFFPAQQNTINGTRLGFGLQSPAPANEFKRSFGCTERRRGSYGFELEHA